jgi:hypothetical protein
VCGRVVPAWALGRWGAGRVSSGVATVQGPAFRRAEAVRCRGRVFRWGSAAARVRPEGADFGAVDSVRASCSPWAKRIWAVRARLWSRRAVVGLSGSVRVVKAARAAETRSRSPFSPQPPSAGSQWWVRWCRGLGTCRPHRQCWDRAVVKVEARRSRPPVAVHSAASWVISRPGVAAEQARPHRRNQVRMSQSSAVRFGPWAATRAAAMRRARWWEASAALVAAALWRARRLR